MKNMKKTKQTRGSVAVNRTGAVMHGLAPLTAEQLREQAAITAALGLPTVTAETLRRMSAESEARFYSAIGVPAPRPATQVVERWNGERWSEHRLVWNGTQYAEVE